MNLTIIRTISTLRRLKPVSSLLTVSNRYKIAIYNSPSFKFYATDKHSQADEQMSRKGMESNPIIRFPTELISEKVGSEEEEKQKLRESSVKSIKYTLLMMGVTIISIGTYTIVQLGKPPVGSDGKILSDDFSHMPIVQQYFYRTLQEMKYYTKLIQEPSREKLLPDELRFPYFQPAYTLVLELTDILVHPDWTYLTGWRFKKRPGIDHFLETLSGSYEIVIYTAEQGLTVFPIIEALDPKNLISYKLVRDATHFVEGHHVKNLDKLNRDLKKVIVIDWNPESVKFHPENVFNVGRWSGNDDDTTLIDLTAFLMTVANSEVDDVRDVLGYYNTFEDGLAAFRDNQRILLEQQEAKNKSKPETPLPVRKWSPSLVNKPSTLS